MTNLTDWDHVFVLVVFFLYPIYAKVSFPGFVRKVLREGEPARIAAYKNTIYIWLGFAGCLVCIWVLLHRDWQDLGVRWPNLQTFLMSLIAASAVIAIVVLPLRYIYRTPERHAELDAQMGDMRHFLPLSHHDETWFKIVSINAGITEELIFRGYLIWYLGHFMGIIWAGTIALVLFGLAHLYQGWKALPGILLISFAAVSLYLYSRSLLVPIIFHIVLDALQGHYITRTRRQFQNSKIAEQV